MYDSMSAANSGMDPEMAVTHIQRLVRGFISRRAVVKASEEEMQFIGMRPRIIGQSAEASDKNVTHQLELAYIKRKAEQKGHIDGYERALIELKDVVADEEGPSMREEMMEERREWMMQTMAEGHFPTDLTGYYASKNPVDASAQDKEGL